MCAGRTFDDKSSIAAIASVEPLGAPAFGPDLNLVFDGEGGSLAFAELLALVASLSCPVRRVGVRFCWGDV